MTVNTERDTTRTRIYGHTTVESVKNISAVYFNDTLEKMAERSMRAIERECPDADMTKALIEVRVQVPVEEPVGG